MRLNRDNMQSAQGGGRFLIRENHDSSTFRTEGYIVRMLDAILFAIGSLDEEWDEGNRVSMLADFIGHTFSLRLLSGFRQR